MKTIILLLFSFTISAQCGLLDPPDYPIVLNLEKSKPKLITKERFFTAALCFSSGFFNGGGEILRNKYHKFKSVHPKANDNYWNPLQSWPNKWLNGDILQGEKFPFSSTALVFLTDGYHLLRTFEKNLMIGAISINLYERQKWYVYALEFIAYSAVWSIGFHTSYSLIYDGMRP
jgi:hypothetical protein